MIEIRKQLPANALDSLHKITI